MTETSSRSRPRNTFMGRLRVGDRTMLMGFMGYALRLAGYWETCRERANGAEEDSQSSLYYLCAGGESEAKQGGGNLAVDPRGTCHLRWG
jgi:hypothetical protein